MDLLTPLAHCLVKQGILLKLNICIFEELSGWSTCKRFTIISSRQNLCRKSTHLNNNLLAIGSLDDLLTLAGGDHPAPANVFF